MLFGKKTSASSLSLSLSPVNLGYQMRQKKKEFGLSLRAHSRSSALFESSGVRPNEDDDEDKEENG